MNWRYGAIKDKNGWFLGEIYQDKDGSFSGYADLNVGTCDTKEELVKDLENMLNDVKNHPHYDVDKNVLTN